MAVPQRNRLIGAVHAARKATDLDDDTYRAMLARLTGKSSSKDMTDAELRQVLDHMNGSTGRRRFASPKASSPIAKKARALWISLHGLGAIADPSEKALRAWVKRQFHVDDLAFVRPSQSFAVVEGLKQWCARLGVEWGAYADPRLCVIERQIALLCDKLGGQPAFPHSGRGFYPITIEAVIQSNFDSAQLDRCIVELGEWLRGENG